MGEKEKMDKNSIIDALDNLEKENCSKNGYKVEQILTKLHVRPTPENKKIARGVIRLLISKRLYPEFETAGDDDVVYSPCGKGSGTYRLSKYRR